MPVPEEVLGLVERFKSNLDAYRHSHYNETQVRREFIDPFFKALGWDIDNTQGYAEAYKDVIHEDALKIGGATKAPDYCFRIGGVRKFFLEAKKPWVWIREEPAPAFQLRRYAWSAKLPLSILTDFEEFAVYDSRVKPDKSDSPAKARVVYFTFREYSKRWDEISSIFSKEAVLKGSFDRYADTNKAKRGTAEVDAAFLAEIESWRELLARNIALRNPGLTQRELNFAVQQTIDRIIFLRICEARDIEPYGQLQSLMNGGSVYARLRQIFHHADERYNSGLFHFRTEAGRAVPDELTLRLAIDDKPLKEIFGKLYYPDSPYAFSVLPTTILGQVYEQFLGKVIRLTPGGQAKVADKPEVKKAGGVYYTPAYIVEYLVKNTVGKLLEGKTLGQIGGGARHAPLRVLDPACGSGSFLLVAYQYLLDWYLARYSESEPEKYAKGKSPRIFKGQGGSWRVTTNERKRILLTHIFGVDIDPQAVEVTKLSLLLKILEGHSGEIIQGLYLHERLLPDLDNNIKCGNSLIGSDFYEGQFNFDEEERLRINAFDWNAEFSEIFKAGGFDVVIGNPPYLNVDDVWGRQDPRLAALKALYAEIYNDKTDILFYFLGKAISLSKTLVGFIVSRAFLEAYKADKLRSHLLKHSAIKEVIDFRDLYVFQGVGITTCLITLRPREKAGDVSAYRFLQKMFPPLPLANLLHDPKYFARVQLPQGALSHQPWSFVSDLERKLNSKVDDRGKPLGSILEIGQGMQTGRNQIFGGHTRHSLEEWDLRHGQYLKRATNSAIRRFWIDGGNEFLLYLEDVEEFHHLPSAVRDYLTSHSQELKARAAHKRGDCLWWRYTWPLHKDLYGRAKILCPYLAERNRFALDARGEYLGLTDTTVLFDGDQPEDMKYILGLLNSRLLTYRFRSLGKLKSGGIMEYFWNSVSKIPIRTINFAEPSDRVRYDRMVKLVGQMLSLNEKVRAAKTPHEKTSLQRQIDAADRQIDALVYELYGLTEEEIRIVEEGQ